MTSSKDMLRSARAGLGGLERNPKRRLAVVTCMDARIDPLAALGLRLGDAHVIRNAGGIVTTDVIRSLAVSQRRLMTNAVDVVMHLDCGMLGLDEDALRSEIASEAGRAVDIDFGGFPDLLERLEASVAQLRSSRVLAEHARIRGLLFDERTGRAAVSVT